MEKTASFILWLFLSDSAPLSHLYTSDRFPGWQDEPSSTAFPGSFPHFPLISSWFFPFHLYDTVTLLYVCVFVSVIIIMCVIVLWCKNNKLMGTKRQILAGWMWGFKISMNKMCSGLGLLFRRHLGPGETRSNISQRLSHRLNGDTHQQQATPLGAPISHSTLCWTTQQLARRHHRLFPRVGVNQLPSKASFFDFFCLVP